MTSFKHSGSLGDVIFSLPIIRSLGGGTLYLNIESDFWLKNIFGDPLAALRKLLEFQPYIEKVEVWNGKECGCNLDRFREHFNNLDFCSILTLADIYVRAFKVGPKVHSRPWLTVPCRRLTGVDIIISRTSRYLSKYFDWSHLLSQYEGRALFLGMREEHKAFTDEFGYIPYFPTETLWEAAEIIAGVGKIACNQNVLFAIAEALKVKTIVELSPWIPNNFYPRSGATYHMVYP